MEVGSIVRFLEVLDAGERAARFVVLEDRGPRLLVREVCLCADMSIAPTFVYLRESLVECTDRAPSVTVKPVKPCGILAPVGARRATFQAVMSAAVDAFPNVTGLVYIDKQRAFFQESGNPTPYSVAITAAESVALGYISI